MLLWGLTMTLDDIMALAASCYSRVSPEPQWKLRQAIEQALLQAHKAGFDAALLPGSVPDAQRQGRLLHKPQSSKQVSGYECIHCGAAYRPTDEQCPRCKAYEARRVTK